MKNKKKKMQALQQGCEFLKNQIFSMQNPIRVLKTELLFLYCHSNGQVVYNYHSRWKGRMQTQGFPLCTGPPGRARSPGTGCKPEHPPDEAAVLNVLKPESPERAGFVSEFERYPVRNKDKIARQKSDGKKNWFIHYGLDKFYENRINTEYRIINNKYKFKFLQTLI